MLRLSDHAYAEIVAAAYDGYPLEACGLLGGVHDATGASARIEVFYRCHNAAESAKLYTIEPRDHLRAERDADARDLDIVGVVHSHTHTDAYPSPTDVAQAPDPGWHYVIVSLRDTAPTMRSYRIVDGQISEEPVVVERR